MVRFNTLAIFSTPFFSLAIVFNVRTSSFDHARRTTFFLAKFRFLVSGVGLVAREADFARHGYDQTVPQHLYRFIV
jgi:hypothetical protein